MSKWLPQGLRRWLGEGVEASEFVVPRKQHTLTRKKISPNALKVMYRLKKAGFASYLVGGGVRDVVLGIRTKDFDVATDATPSQLRSLFENSRIIGRRFRLVHVYYPGEIIEVSTFRAEGAQESQDNGDMIRSDNTFGTIEEDAYRRDFTVNALYYNIQDFSIVDYMGGMADLQARVLRIIGDPEQRFKEDPVRLLRAIRFAAKLDFCIEDKALAVLKRCAPLLEFVPKSRILHEFEKLFFQGHAFRTYELLQQHRYFRILFPNTVKVLSSPNFDGDRQLLDRALQVTDQRFVEGKSLNPGFLIGVMLWPVYKARLFKAQSDSKRMQRLVNSVIGDVIHEQQSYMAIPKRYIGIIQSTWMLQFHMEKRRPKRILFVLNHRYYRAAFDMLQLRCDVGEPLGELVSWWDTLYRSDRDQRHDMIQALREPKSKRKAKKT